MTFDYVIVGARTAGCVLAHRLSADPGTIALLVESGERDTNPLITVPRLQRAAGRHDDGVARSDPAVRTDPAG